MKLKEAIRKFIDNSRKYGCYQNKTIVKNCIIGKDNHPAVFLNKIRSRLEDETINSDILDEAIKEAVQAYTRKKDNAIDIFKGLVTCINWEMKSDITIAFPEIQISNSFERLMFIAKYIQTPDKKIEDLEDHLWVGKRTIEEDLKKLRGLDDDPLQICKRQFIIPDTERSRGSFRMPSTVHPLFLTGNLTQVITMLKGLKLMAEDPGLKYYAISTAEQIWEQLSDYARERIETVFSTLMPEEIEWFKSLEKDKTIDDEDESGRSFLTERFCSEDYGPNCLIDCLKNGKSCAVEYREDDGSSVFFDHVQIRSYRNNEIIVIIDGKEKCLDPKRILKSTYLIEKLP